MTNINIPTYSELYKLTKRRLKGMRKIAQNRDHFGMSDVYECKYKIQQKGALL